MEMDSGARDYSTLNWAIKALLRLADDEKIKGKDKLSRDELKTALGILNDFKDGL